MKSEMKFFLRELNIVFSKTIENIPFNDITYFFGQMGSGKTSIARLINYCLGGSIHLSPALQSEFISVELILQIKEKEVTIQRERNSEQVTVSWEMESGEFYTLQLPARKPDGIVLPGTNIEQLSDLLFYLSDITPPKVRKSKIKEDSELQRLSFRDLFWYCYIDQDNIDSSFFNLDDDADVFKRLKSRDVMRFLLGFHQEKVAELEAELQNFHIQTLQLNTAATSLKSVIKEANIGSEEEIVFQIDELNSKFQTNYDVINHEPEKNESFPHGADILKERARNLSNEIQSLEDALADVQKRIDQDTRHRNEISILNVKVDRTAAARAVLGGVEFCSCPRCAQILPIRDGMQCIVCGQDEPARGIGNMDSRLIKEDAKSRILELNEIINLQEDQKQLMQERLDEMVSIKSVIDNEISQQLARYDSAYLSTVLLLEKENSQIAEKIKNLNHLRAIPKKVNELLERAAASQADEIRIRAELKLERVNAERDLTNLDRLKVLFLDCLIRCQLPGINSDSIVNIKVSDFLPLVTNTAMGDIAVTSFSNLSSGGKKTLFKACFAIAVHRLAVEIDALMPSILIIDSPMKNISERENKVQFENFHNLIYELVSHELVGTQIILIDKEHFDPSDKLFLNMSVRHMKLDEQQFPPLIPYYRE